MAKQRGIHQISGKINNLCYYEQKYVRGGLIRRINEAMSERLKTDPVFANTRRANKIFGGCSIYASALLEFFGSRNTFLFKPYRHALLTKLVFKYLINEESSESYPMIPSTSIGITKLSYIIDGVVKNKIRDSFPELPVYAGKFQVDGEYDFVFTSQSLLDFCRRYKCVGVQISISRAHYIYATGFSAETNGYVMPETNPGGRGTTYNILGYEMEEEVIIRSNVGTVDDADTFWVVYAAPILSMHGDRPVTGETGASCGIVSFKVE